MVSVVVFGQRPYYVNRGSKLSQLILIFTTNLLLLLLLLRILICFSALVSIRCQSLCFLGGGVHKPCCSRPTLVHPWKTDHYCFVLNDSLLSLFFVGLLGWRGTYTTEKTRTAVYCCPCTCRLTLSSQFVFLAVETFVCLFRFFVWWGWAHTHTHTGSTGETASPTSRERRLCRFDCGGHGGDQDGRRAHPDVRGEGGQPRILPASPEILEKV